MSNSEQKSTKFLIQKQAQLMREYSNLETIQTNYSYDLDFYTYIQKKLDKLDEEADKIRRQLDGVVYAL